MDLALLVAFLFVWIATFGLIGQKFRAWRERRTEYKRMLPRKKRRHWPFRRAVRHEEAKRRVLYRPPKK